VPRRGRSRHPGGKKTCLPREIRGRDFRVMAGNVCLAQGSVMTADLVSCAVWKLPEVRATVNPPSRGRFPISLPETPRNKGLPMSDVIAPISKSSEKVPDRIYII